jgi:hypothetical protein
MGAVAVNVALLATGFLALGYLLLAVARHRYGGQEQSDRGYESANA